MKRMNLIIESFLIAAILLPQAGCALFTAQTVAVTAGKMVYDKVKDDKDKNEDSKAE